MLPADVLVWTRGSLTDQACGRGCRMAEAPVHRWLPPLVVQWSAPPRMSAAAMPLQLAFLGCGFIARVHSAHLRALRGLFTPRYASRDLAKAELYTRQFGGAASYGDYESAIADPKVDAVVVAVPPALHLDLTLRALAAGKHVLVEKPAFPSAADYAMAQRAAATADRVVLVGENDHYKPLAVTLRRLLAEGVIGEMVFLQLTTVAHRLKSAEDWRNDEHMAGGDAFFEEGIHWLHMAGGLGPTIESVHGFRPSVSREGPDRRAKSMLVAFRYDNDAVGTLYYSREIPSLFKGLRISKIMGRKGAITFESNGLFVFAHGGWRPRLYIPGLLRDIRGYRAMYRDFAAAIRDRRPPEMSLERALADQALMDRIYAGVG